MILFEDGLVFINDLINNQSNGNIKYFSSPSEALMGTLRTPQLEGTITSSSDYQLTNSFADNGFSPHDYENKHFRLN